MLAILFARMWRFFGLPRLVEDDLCPLPSPPVGPGHGVRDWSKFPLVKTRDPCLAPGWARVRDWSIQVLVADGAWIPSLLHRHVTGQTTRPRNGAWITSLRRRNVTGQTTWPRNGAWALSPRRRHVTGQMERPPSRRKCQKARKPHIIQHAVNSERGSMMTICGRGRSLGK